MGSLRNFNLNLSTFFSLKDKKLSIEKAYTEGIYADTPANRKLGRVGMSYAEWDSKQGKKEENIDNISVYRLGKVLEGVKIHPRTIKDHKECFLISFEPEDFTKENISKTKETLERLGAKIYVSSSSSSHFIKAFKQDTKIEESEQEIFKIGDYKLDTVQNVLITKNGEKVSLTPKEVDLLKMFASNPNKFLSRDEILEQVWGESNYYNSRSMDVYIGRLREKLAGDKDIKLLTIHWKGFKLSLPKKKSNTEVTEQDTIKDIVNKTSTLKSITGKKLDAIIEYSNSIEDIPGIKVREGATDKEKREAIASFYMHTAELEGEEGKIAEDLDSIIEDALNDYVPSKKKEEVKKEESKQKGVIINKETLKKINDHFGFEDEEGSWFVDTPMALMMADDKEFSDVIEKFSEYHILSQSGGYKNDGTRKNMLECNVEYEIVPKGTADEDVEMSKKTIVVDNKTTIKDILSKLGSQ